MGQKASDEEVKKLFGRTVIEGNKITEWDDSAKKMTGQSTFTLDPAAKPKTMDLKFVSGELKGETQRAIYELGNDTLRVCYSFGPAEKRPTEFAAKGDG